MQYAFADLVEMMGQYQEQSKRVGIEDLAGERVMAMVGASRWMREVMGLG